MVRRANGRYSYITALILLSAILPWAPARLWAQGEASLGGIVTDATGASIPGATINVRNLESGTTRSSVTDASGRFDVALLGVGKYEVTAEKDGFDKVSKSGIILVLGQRAAVDFTLQIGEVKQTVQ